MNQVSVLRDVIKTTWLTQLSKKNRRTLLESIDPSVVDVKQEISKVTDFVLSSKKWLKSLENNLGINLQYIFLFSQYFSSVEEMKKFLVENKTLTSVLPCYRKGSAFFSNFKIFSQFISSQEDLRVLATFSNNYFRNLFSSNEESLFIMVDFIKRIDGGLIEFDKLYDSIRQTAFFRDDLERANIRFFLSICNSIDEFIDISQNRKLFNILLEADYRIISKFIEWYWSKEKVLLLLLDNIWIRDFILTFSGNFFEILIKSYITREDFEEFLKDTEMKKWAHQINISNLEILSTLVNSKEDFRKLLSNKNIRDNTCYWNNYNLGKIFDIFKFPSLESFSRWVSSGMNIQLLNHIHACKFEKLISLYPHKKDIKNIPNNIVKFLPRIDINVFDKIWSLYWFQNKQDFELFCQNEKIIDFIKYINPSKLELLFAIYKFKARQEFETVVQNNSIREIFLTLDEDRLNLFFKFYKVKKPDKLQSFCKRLLKFSVNNISNSNIKLLEVLMKFSKGIVKFEQFFQSNCVLEILKRVNISSELFLSILQQSNTLENFELISKNRYFYWIDSWNETITSLGSQFLTELIDLQLQSKLSEIDVLKLKIELFIETKKVPINTWEKFKRRDISIYLRYWHKVDYPEIAEAFILFVQAYKKLWFSQIFGTIRIIPRYKNVGPSQEVLENLATKFYWNVSWEKFEKALHQGSIAVFLSHSTNSWTVRRPSIISEGMDVHKNDIVSKLELEKSYQKNSFSQESSMQEIFEEIFANLQAIEAYYINKK